MRKLMLCFMLCSVLSPGLFSQEEGIYKQEVDALRTLIETHRSPGSSSQLNLGFFNAFEMISNGSGSISGTVGFDVTKAPATHGAYSSDWYRDVLLGGASVLGLPSGMQNAGGWYFVAAGPETIIDHNSAVNRWTRNWARNSALAGNGYEIRFTAGGGRGFTTFTSFIPINVPFEVWSLASTESDTSDDVRMIPWVLDNEFFGLGDSTGLDVFTFVLDHQASGGNDDPFSDWVYIIMPEDSTPGQAGYNQFVVAADSGFYNAEGSEHMARVVLMNWNRHQGESTPGAADGPINAMPETGTVFRIVLFEGVAANVNCPTTPFKDCPITTCVEIDMTGSAEVLGSFTAELNWDPAQLDFVSHTGLLAGFTGLVNTDSTSVGRLLFNGASASGVSGVFDVVCVDFNVIGDSVGSTGNVSVNYSAMAAALTFTDLLPVLNSNDCAYTIGAGGLLGDVNGDGFVNSTDALIILSFDVSLPLPQPFLDLINAGFGDVNADSFTNSTDALIILSFDVALPVPFPVGQPFCP